MEDLDELREEEENPLKDMYMTFKSGNEHFGISVSNVIEIIGMQAITQVPDVEDYIRGLINLRGKIIPVIDVRVRFRQEAPLYGSDLYYCDQCERYGAWIDRGKN